MEIFADAHRVELLAFVFFLPPEETRALLAAAEQMEAREPVDFRTMEDGDRRSSVGTRKRSPGCPDLWAVKMGTPKRGSLQGVPNSLGSMAITLDHGDVSSQSLFW